MPSIEACNSSQEKLTSVSSTIEIFDRYKSKTQNEEASDSEESFHLPLDDDIESVSNGHDEKLENGSSESFRLNISGPDDALLQNELEKKENIKTDKKVDCNVNMVSAQHNLPNPNLDKTTEKLIESTENTSESCTTNSTSNSRESKGPELNLDQIDKKDGESENINIEKCKELKVISENQAEEKVSPVLPIDVPMQCETKFNTAGENTDETDKIEEDKDDLLKQLDDCINSENIEKIKEPQNDEPEESEHSTVNSVDNKDKSPDNIKATFEEKSNEMDLLNISMVRGTEEDDLTDDETELSDKSSDDEHSDKIDNEQDNCHNEETESSFDNEQFGFDVSEENQLQYTDENQEVPMEIDNDLLNVSAQVNDEKIDVLKDDGPEAPSITNNDDNAKTTDTEVHNVPPKFENTAASNKVPNVDKIPQSPPVLECFQEIPDDSSDTIVCDMDKSLNEKNASVDGSEKKATVESEPQRIKRPFSQSNFDDYEVVPKKSKFSTTNSLCDKSKASAITESQVASTKKKCGKYATLFSFSEFMKTHGLGSRLSRADLEQLCIQKICEALMLKTSEGEQNQYIKKLEKTIDGLKKDISQLYKQAKDLEIVNRNLMYELKSNAGQKRPLVPIKITRSVGLQVRFNPNADIINNSRKRISNSSVKQTASGDTSIVSTSASTKTTTTITTKTATTTNNNVIKTAGNKTKSVTNQPSPNKQVRRSVGSKSQNHTKTATPVPKTIPTPPAKPSKPIVSHVLIQPKPAPPANNTKRQSDHAPSKKSTAPINKTFEAPKSKGAGVIDLTDEDDRLSTNAPAIANTLKIVQKSPNKTVNGAKVVPIGPIGKVITTKSIPVNQKAVTVQQTTASTNNRTTTIQSGIRLTGNSVLASTPNGPQLLYVVPTINSNVAGAQKVAFVNGVLSTANLSGPSVSVVTNRTTQPITLKPAQNLLRPKHPAPLPVSQRIMLDPKLKPLLPKPFLTIKKIETGIILQWKMPYNLDSYESIASYQLYAYQETNAAPCTDMWRKVGDVKALALPMACTLTQFADKNKYYFAVRSVDIYKRIGAFSDPEAISL